mmetsp:Transcript_99349/g.320403  ORF Transcript_99349/g.320403 Transcript_99349/m.320403 type:complete len:203 (+) Transcript_99349:876-1484(+)
MPLCLQPSMSSLSFICSSSSMTRRRLTSVACSSSCTPMTCVCTPLPLLRPVGACAPCSPRKSRASSRPGVGTWLALRHDVPFAPSAAASAARNCSSSARTSSSRSALEACCRCNSTARTSDLDALSSTASNICREPCNSCRASAAWLSAWATFWSAISARSSASAMASSASESLSMRPSLPKSLSQAPLRARRWAVNFPDVM